MAATGKPAQITPFLTTRVNQREQPLGGEMRFLSTPTLMRSCSLKVSLVCHRPISEPMLFRIVKGEVYSMPISPDSIVWEGPIDSGTAKTLYFSFTPVQVGSHRFVLERKLDKSWSQLGSLFLAIDEDGKTICTGSVGDCKTTLVPPHDRRVERPIRIKFPINELEPRRLQDRHFSSEFRFTPGTKMRDSVFVDFDLECHVSLYEKVQFLVEHSTNIAVSKLPVSWGDNAGPAPDYRFYNGRFAFVPLRAGLTSLTFRVLGKHPSARGGDRLNTDFIMYLVIGTSGEILFAGSFNPYTRFKDPSDPMLGSLQSLLAITDRDFRTRNVFSQPDYRGQEIDARDGIDSTSADSTH